MDSPARPTLGPIRAVTYAVPNLDVVQEAYTTVLNYRFIGRDRLSARQACAWGAPALEGREVLILGPQSGEDVHLRFVQSPFAAGWRALQTFGWNATEFVVQDLDGLAERLEQSVFEIIGPPKGLSRFPMIRAMQVIGPAGECCYFTEVGPGSGLTLAPALSFVGRVFIVVSAGPDADELFTPYQAFANAHDPPVATPVQVISDAHGLPSDTLHRHGLVRLPSGCLIELDAYPPQAKSRRTEPGGLPCGMAMVSFEVETHTGWPFIAPPTPCDLPGGGGGAAGCLRGAVGELIELVDSGSEPIGKGAL